MADKNLDVVVVGELNIDLVLWGVSMPEYEKEFLAEDMRFSMGASSAITAHNLSAVGGRVGYIGKVGADTFGDFMIQQLDAGGVETSHILRDKNLKTGATIVLANRPKKALLTYMGAMEHLAIEDMDWDYIRRAKHLHLGCYYLQPGIRQDAPELFAKAKEMGLTTSLDTNWDPKDEWGENLMELLEYTDIFFPNEDEALRIAHAHDFDEALETLRQKVKVLVVKRGEKGATFCVDDTTYTAPGFEVEPVETTGAGDSFNAGFLFKYLQKAEWHDCLRFGNACGAIAVTELGGTEAFRNKHLLHSKLESFLHNEQSPFANS